MRMKLKPVKPIEKDEEGNITFNLCADAANADWLRAARLLKQRKRKELEKLSNTKMYYVIDDESEDELQ